MLRFRRSPSSLPFGSYQTPRTSRKVILVKASSTGLGIKVLLAGTAFSSSAGALVLTAEPASAAAGQSACGATNNNTETCVGDEDSGSGNALLATTYNNNTGSFSGHFEILVWDGSAWQHYDNILGVTFSGTTQRADNSVSYSQWETAQWEVICWKDSGSNHYDESNAYN